MIEVTCGNRSMWLSSLWYDVYIIIHLTLLTSDEVDVHNGQRVHLRDYLTL